MSSLRRPERHAGSGSSARGFTLVETLMASGILASMSLIVTLWINGTMDVWSTTDTQGHVRQRTQQAIHRMASELRSCTRAAAGSPPNIAIPAPPNNTSMTFYLPADLDTNGTIIDGNGNIEWDAVNAVQYVYDAPSRQLRRVAGGNAAVLSGDVQSVTFAHAGIDPTLYPNEVRITLTVQATTQKGRAVSASSTELVKLRN